MNKQPKPAESEHGEVHRQPSPTHPGRARAEGLPPSGYWCLTATPEVEIRARPGRRQQVHAFSEASIFQLLDLIDE